MSLVTIRSLSRIFDVSKPWLNRVLERRSKAYLTAVSDVSFDIKDRSVYALVGESGSGKSTIGKMLVGLLNPSKGSVEIRGVDLAREADAAKVDEEAFPSKPNRGRESMCPSFNSMSAAENRILIARQADLSIR